MIKVAVVQHPQFGWFAEVTKDGRRRLYTTNYCDKSWEAVDQAKAWLYEVGHDSYSITIY